MAHALAEDLLMIYKANREVGDYQITSDDIARRSLKNVVLSYLVKLETNEAQQLCLDQFYLNKNMTNTMAAFNLIADSDFSQRNEILESFESQWRHDPLVMDKWFVAQAISHREDTLESVKALMDHELFSIKNPNKVRSLIGAFCSANLVRFHATSGAGYRFLADQVIRLDALNPQIASRMLRVISRWQRYDEKRQALMKEQLERIVAAKSISKDVYEIAAKSLQV